MTEKETTCVNSLFKKEKTGVVVWLFVTGSESSTSKGSVGTLFGGSTAPMMYH